MIVQVAPTTATALIRGESGVGKELVARAIHAMSPRVDGPFVKVNCAALPGALLESELFGHEKGAFTGAFSQKPGQFEYANQGTICLDEIGELPRELQAKLLHVVQDAPSSLGWEGVKFIRADVRIVATTNRDLEAAMSAGEVSRGSLLSAQRRRDLGAAPSGASRGYSLPVRELFPGDASIPGGRTEVHLTPEDGRRMLNEPLLAGQCPGSSRMPSVDLSWWAAAFLARDPRAARSAASRLPIGPPPGQGDGWRSPAELGLKAIARRAARDAERAALLEVLERVRWNRTEGGTCAEGQLQDCSLSKLTECGIPPARSKGNA